MGNLTGRQQTFKVDGTSKPFFVLSKARHTLCQHLFNSKQKFAIAANKRAMSNEAKNWLELSGGSVAHAAPLGGIVIQIISPERVIERLGLVCQFTALLGIPSEKFFLCWQEDIRNLQSLEWLDRMDSVFGQFTDLSLHIC